jgi:hypothetical protein
VAGDEAGKEDIEEVEEVMDLEMVPVSTWFLLSRS